MFRDWGFLITEMMGLIILAALLGLFAGWLIFGARKGGGTDEGAQTASLREELAACGEARAKLEARVASLQDDLQSARLARDHAQDALSDVARASATPQAMIAQSDPADSAPEEDDDPVAQPEAMAPDAPPLGTRPQALAEPRDGKPDDLKQIKGVGVKLEALCHRLGFYHFDQIASWTEDEVAWVDANLEGFSGRVTRDDWVGQARTLAVAQRLRE